ncbi:MAG: ComF family protein [Candidatus Omnitrophica bacterium]|nr:ComF family protein [Candidatus Omnitrophota bacterium]
MLNLVKLKLFWASFIDIIYPRYCLICSKSIDDSSYEGACKACLEKIDVNAAPFCKKCGASLKSSTAMANDSCAECRHKQYYFDRALSVCEYAGIARKCIQLFKYKRKLKIGRNLSKIMLAFLKKHFTLDSIDLIMAVPLHRSKLKERGFNQAEILAEFIRLNLDIPASFDNLKRVRKTLSQYQLPLGKRQKNMRDAFGCADKVFFKNKSILIVDDIFTTGATLNECSRVLKNAGAKKVYTLTIAR